MNETIRKFYEETKVHFDNPNNAFENIVVPPETWTKIFYKTYPRFPKVSLYAENPKSNLEILLEKRQSARDFEPLPLDFGTFSRLILFAFGEKTTKDPALHRRMYPSAGARYTIEAYIYANHVSDLSKGVYHFCPKNNTLEQLLTGHFTTEMAQIQNIPNLNSSITIILASVISRLEVKYALRAYKLALLEAGHIGQNLCLLSTDLGLKCCPIDGFDDDKAIQLLDLSEDEIPLYMFNIGL
jgi:SagB-type dehydrogenase family enzyme